MSHSDKFSVRPSLSSAPLIKYQTPGRLGKEKARSKGPPSSPSKPCPMVSVTRAVLFRLISDVDQTRA